MNRQKRRELAKKINTPQKLERIVEQTIRQKEIDLKNEYNEKLLGYIDVFIVMTSYVLDLEDIPKEHIIKIVNRILFNIDSFRTGQLNSDDFQVIKKEVEEWGVKL